MPILIMLLGAALAALTYVLLSSGADEPEDYLEEAKDRNKYKKEVKP